MDQKINRRSLTGIASLALGGYALSACADEPSPDGNVDTPSDYTVSADQAEEYINNLDLRDFYIDAPDADPEKVFGLSPEMLKIAGAMPVTAETRGSKHGFAKGLALQMRKVAVGGQHFPDDFIRAREQGYPVGERASNNKLLGKFGEYVRVNYLDHLVDGFISKSNSEHIVSLKDYFEGYAENMELVIVDSRWHDVATLLVEAMYAGPDEKRPGAEVFSFTIGRPSSTGDWREARITHFGDISLYAEENSNDTYDLRFVRLNLGPRSDS